MCGFCAIQYDIVNILEMILFMEFIIEDFENVDINLKDFIDFVMSGKDEHDIIPSGFNWLDILLNGGFRRGDLCFIAARFAIGKTYFALQLANNISKTGKKVLYFTPEFEEDELTNKLYSKEIDYNRIIIDDNYHLNPTYVKCVIEHTKADAVIIDSLDNLEGYNEDLPLEDIAFDLRCVAEALQVPIICTKYALVNEGEMPELADIIPLDIEQEASVIFTLFQDEFFYCTNSDYAEIFVIKNKYGSIGKIELTFDADKHVFIEKELQKARNAFEL